jgi:hypothetical protein
LKTKNYPESCPKWDGGGIGENPTFVKLFTLPNPCNVSLSIAQEKHEQLRFSTPLSSSPLAPRKLTASTAVPGQ